MHIWLFHIQQRTCHQHSLALDTNYRPMLHISSIVVYGLTRLKASAPNTLPASILCTVNQDIMTEKYAHHLKISFFYLLHACSKFLA